MKNKKIVEVVVPAFCLTFLVLFVLLIVSAAFKWGIKFQGAFMVGILLLSLVATIYPLIKRTKINIGELIVVVFCFILLIAAIIVFASVSKGEYREPVIQILSSVTGGLLTLYGIGITIKFNRLEKEKDEIEKAKPNIFPVSSSTWSQLSEDTKIKRELLVRDDLSNVEIAGKTEPGYLFAPLLIANSDLSMCLLKGIGINDKYFIVFHNDNIILKGSNCSFLINYSFKTFEDLNSIQLVLGDMLGNNYSCYVSYEIDKKRNRKKNPIYITGVKQIIPLKSNAFETFNE